MKNRILSILAALIVTTAFVVVFPGQEVSAQEAGPTVTVTQVTTPTQEAWEIVLEAYNLEYPPLTVERVEAAETIMEVIAPALQGYEPRDLAERFRCALQECGTGLNELKARQIYNAFAQTSTNFTPTIITSPAQKPAPAETILPSGTVIAGSVIVNAAEDCPLPGGDWPDGFFWDPNTCEWKATRK